MRQSRFSETERILDISVVVGAFATIPLTLLLEQGWNATWLLAIDWVVWGVFVAELVFKVLRKKIDYGHTLFLATVVVFSFPALPAILGLVRVARLARIVRLTRSLRLARMLGATAWAIGGLRAIFGRTGMIYVGLVSFLVLLAGGAGIALVGTRDRARWLSGWCLVGDRHR